MSRIFKITWEHKMGLRKAVQEESEDSEVENN